MVTEAEDTLSAHSPDIGLIFWYRSFTAFACARPVLLYALAGIYVYSFPEAVASKAEFVLLLDRLN